MSGPSRAALVEEIRAFIPPLSQHLHKGAAGKLGVFGGSAEYSGAPYFAAISAMRTGADLAHVICTQAAATAIKSYCPDVIVHPLLPSRSSTSSSSGGDLTEEERSGVDAAMKEISEWLPRFTGLVLGSGLGRDKAVLLCAKQIIEQAKNRKMPLVIDGDGISSVVCVWPSLVEDYKEVVLTPNFPEYQRLCKAVGCAEDTSIMELSKKMGNVTIVQKGEVDRISDGRIVVECTEEGSPRRCGGQGDITSGSIGTFLSWAHAYKEKESLKYPPNVLAGYAGCLMTRGVSRVGFAKKGRSVLVSDMIEEIGHVFVNAFEKSVSSL
jgi:ATP-dependent NAD(P)H-hydrate dehydratase